MILVVDASKSMEADDGTGRPKIEAAKSALNTSVDELPDDAKVGLRVYGAKVSGTGRAKGCADTRLVSPVAPLDREGLRSEIGALTPRGFTPIGGSLRGAVEDLGRRSRRRSCSSPTAATTASPRAVRRREADLQRRHRPQDPGGRLPGQAGRAAPAPVHRRGRRRALRRRRQRPGARGPAARADRPRAAAVRDRGQAPRSHVRARHGQALRSRASTPPRSAPSCPRGTPSRSGRGRR